MTLSDAAARATALDVFRSFIVQAPAGSGKTGLLTQRILALLSLVDNPEEVVAITFTKKAAAEMKDRVLQALAHAEDPHPKDAFAENNAQLARKVLQRDRQRNWRLRDNPNRLRILTIDALCHAIVRQLPLLTELGGRADISENPKEWYRQAARATLDVFAREPPPWKKAVERLFAHLDNDWARIESMLVDLLERRDQWLRHVIPGDDAGLREGLNQTLQIVIEKELRQVQEMIPPSWWPELRAIMDFSRSILSMNQETRSPWVGRSAPPGTAVADVLMWQELAATLLTQEGGWRKKWDVRLGFPAKTHAKTPGEKELFNAMKERVAALVEELDAIPNLQQGIHKLRLIPSSLYSGEQWDVLQALLTLLKNAVGLLMVEFASRESVDHGEVARRAIQALGSSDNPTDLALRLDHRIRHILVDEFQDTSRVQYELLQRLVAGWTPQEGQTLFLVGDPMQSIYRFREADVGLFLMVQQQGIAPVMTHPLFLEVNFRSLPGLVTWVNETMQAAFPQVACPEKGAVPFKTSQSSLSGGEEDPLVHPWACTTRDEEAQKTVAIAAEARHRGQSVCILVRTRNHLEFILPHLQKKGLRYQAVELHPLGRLSAIQDLLALTRALIHPGDGIAWLAVLRAPWCGLSLADLNTVANFNPRATVIACLNHPDLLELLSRDGQTILERVRPIFNDAANERGRWSAFPGPGTLRNWIEGTWRRLGGAATLTDMGSFTDVESFLSLLESLENNGAPLDTQTLAEHVARLYASVDADADPNLVVMTIHKAKGLEFDCVIMPGLDRRPKTDDKRLLLWMEPPALEGALVPLLAPIGRWDGDAEDEIYRFVWDMEQEKSRNEVCRLLYVAVTRAKQHLHLLGLAQEKQKIPASGSFLSVLWQSLADTFAVNDAKTGEEETLASPIPPPVRLVPQWQLPPPPTWTRVAFPDDLPQQESILFDWVGNQARLVGTVIHRFLAIMALQGIESWSVQRILEEQKRFRRHLEELGLPQSALDDAVNQVIRGLTHVLDSPRGRWLLDGRHQEAHAEWRLSGMVNHRVVTVIIDRSFVDDNNIRWICDYKTSQHEGGDRDGFLANEKARYQQQLHLYAQLVQALEQRPIHLGLYFPLMDAWLDWPWEG
ncbi:MAG: UvrD-helicase domain-containing protein [Magnetococcales bacterium]|nr:UvrD-helicase domain-containing protein [Magnetococcales bacterium]